jgi:hypothetical protein
VRSRLYLSMFAVASLLASPLFASAQSPANSADRNATIPGTSVPADPSPIVGSDADGRSMPPESPRAAPQAFALLTSQIVKPPRLRRRRYLPQVQRQAALRGTLDSRHGATGSNATYEQTSKVGLTSSR